MKDSQWVDIVNERIKMEGKQKHVDVLKSEVEILATKLQEHGTGHIHTTIHTLKHRIEELQKEIKKEE